MPQNKVDVQSVPVLDTIACEPYRFMVNNGTTYQRSGDGADASYVSLEAKVANDGKRVISGAKISTSSKLEITLGQAVVAADLPMDIASNSTGQAIEAASGDAILGKLLQTGAIGDIVEFEPNPAPRQA